VRVWRELRSAWEGLEDRARATLCRVMPPGDPFSSAA
jgi:hypothetical protein